MIKWYLEHMASSITCCRWSDSNITILYRNFNQCLHLKTQHTDQNSVVSFMYKYTYYSTCSETNEHSVAEGVISNSSTEIKWPGWNSLQRNASTSHNCRQGKLLLNVSSLHLMSWCYQLSVHHPSASTRIINIKEHLKTREFLQGKCHELWLDPDILFW